MRRIDGLASDYVNETWPANPNITLGLTLFSVVGGTFGIPANLLVLFLSFFSSKINGSYKYFVANLAFLDLSCCFSLIFATAFHLYNRFADVPYTATKCTIILETTYGIGMCMAFALPLTSINRYLVIVKNKDEWFDKKRIVLLCLASYIPVIHPIITFLFAPRVGYYPYCELILYIPNFMQAFLAFIICIIYPTIMFCNYSIYRALSLHANEMTATLNRTPEQLANERSILKAIAIQGFVPVITALPLGIVFCGFFFSSWDTMTLVIFDFGPDLQFTTLDACWIIFLTTPTFDALIALLVMKQYRRALTSVIETIKSRFSKNSVVSSFDTPNHSTTSRKKPSPEDTMVESSFCIERRAYDGTEMEMI